MDTLEAVTKLTEQVDLMLLEVEALDHGPNHNAAYMVKRGKLVARANAFLDAIKIIRGS
jgi:hypothetical protein